MKKTMILTAVLVSLFSASHAQLQLPQPSPKGKVTQTAGLTDISIEYSSPAVKGRTVWGDLVPYNEVWRTGANKATQINFSKDVTVGDKEVKAGTYSFFAIPQKDEWTLILNSNTELWGSDDYSAEKDVVRVKVKPEAINHRERLTYIISDFNDEQAMIQLEWEKVRVSLPVKLNTAKQAEANIESTLGGTWRNYASSARYMLENKKDYDAGLKYIDQSISLKNDWYNNWLKAKLLAAKGNTKEAYTYAAKAKELGDKVPDNFFYKKDVEKALVDWKPAGKK